MSELFVPEYAADGYPRLDQADVDYLQGIKDAGVLVVGDQRLFDPVVPVTAEHDVDRFIEELYEVADRAAALPLSSPLGVAAGQTAIRTSQGETPDIFLAKIDPNPDGGKLTDVLVPFINFTVEEQSDELLEAKHGCLTTGPLSPIVATPKSIVFRALDRNLNEISGRLTGFPSAVAWHEDKHNERELMVNQPNLAVVNCVPQRHIEQSRALSTEQSKTMWPLRYTAEQIAAILSGKHPLVSA